MIGIKRFLLIMILILLAGELNQKIVSGKVEDSPNQMSSNYCIHGIKDVYARCTLKLYPTNSSQKGNGVVWIDKVKKNEAYYRLLIHIYNMPEPSKFGDYNSYELVAYESNKDLLGIKLQRHTLANGNTLWSEEKELPEGYHLQTKLEIRVYNSITNKLGPTILRSSDNKSFIGLH